MNTSDILSLVLTLATVLYVLFTWKITSENKKMREAQTEPRISLSIQPREEYINFLNMIVENIGQGPAYEVRFELNHDFEFAKGHFLSELGFIKNGIAYFAPRQKIEFFLTNMVEGFNDKMNNEIRIKVTYNSKAGKRYEDEYRISLKELVGLTNLESPKSRIANALEMIAKDLSKISSSLSQLTDILNSKR